MVDERSHFAAALRALEDRVGTEEVCKLAARLLITYAHRRRNGEIQFEDDSGVVTVKPIIRPREQLN